MLVVGALAFVGFFAGRRYRLKRYEMLIYSCGAVLIIIAGLFVFAAHDLILPSDTIFYSAIIGVTVGHHSEWLLEFLRR
jgi:hypothetical protein